MSAVYNNEGVRSLFLEGLGASNIHNDLFGRSTADAHPISAITNLQPTLDDHEARITANEALLVNHETRITNLESSVAGFQSGDSFLMWAM